VRDNAPAREQKEIFCSRAGNFVTGCFR